MREQDLVIRLINDNVSSSSTSSCYLVTLDFHVILSPNELSTQFELRFPGAVVIVMKSFINNNNNNNNNLYTGSPHHESD